MVRQCFRRPATKLKNFNFATVKGSFIKPLTTSKLLHFGCLEGGREIQWFIILITDGQISKILSLTFWFSTHPKCWKTHFHSVQVSTSPSMRNLPYMPIPTFLSFSQTSRFWQYFWDYILPQWNTTKINSCDKVISSPLKTGPNTAQKWQQLALLSEKSFVPKFNFFSLSVLSKTVENENFD